MTTLIQDINAALEELEPAGGVFNAINTAEPPVFPFIIFLRVVSAFNNTLDGPSDLQTTRVQVDVLHRTYSLAADLATQVQQKLMDRFSSFPNACVPLTAFDAYEDAIKAYRVSTDYDIAATN